MAFHQPFQVIGFHSCDREVGLRVVKGEDYLKHSLNTWDWLGPGVYFWEQNPQRALEYAKECAEGKQKFAGQIRTPFVIGAIIELKNCPNLIEPGSINIVKEAHDELIKTIQDSKGPVPKNSGANRALDCAVFKYLHESNVKTDRTEYDTIRSPFHEGGELYTDSNFSKRFHMEVCVRNPLCIKGYFLPLPHEEFNPYHSKDFIPTAK